MNVSISLAMFTFLFLILFFGDTGVSKNDPQYLKSKSWLKLPSDGMKLLSQRIKQLQWSLIKSNTLCF